MDSTAINITGNDSKNKSKLAIRDESRKLALLLALDRIPHPTEKDLIEATDIPKRTIHSLFKTLSRMRVAIERVNGRRHGYYEMTDVGIYNLERASEVIQSNYPEIFEKIESHAQAKEGTQEDVIEDGDMSDVEDFMFPPNMPNPLVPSARMGGALSFQSR